MAHKFIKKGLFNDLLYFNDYYQDDQHDEVVKEFLGNNPMNQFPDAEK